MPNKLLNELFTLFRRQAWSWDRRNKILVEDRAAIQRAAHKLEEGLSTQDATSQRQSNPRVRSLHAYLLVCLVCRVGIRSASGMFIVCRR